MGGRRFARGWAMGLAVLMGWAAVCAAAQDLPAGLVQAQAAEASLPELVDVHSADGLEQARLRRDADGDTQDRTTVALLLPVGEGTLVSHDSQIVQWMRPDGSLIHASMAEARNGALTLEVRLDPDPEGRWRVTGRMGEKPVEAVLDGEPSTTLSAARVRRELMAQPHPQGAGSEGLAWSPVNPLRLLPTRVTLVSAQGPDAFVEREEMGSTVMAALLDRNSGTLVRYTLPIKGAVLTVERLQVQGSP